MNQVSPQSIEDAIGKIDSLSEDALDQLIETFTLEQQDLVNYILQAGVEYENEDLNVFAIYYFAIVYQSFRNDGKQLQTITEDHIDAFQEPFLLALDSINKDEDYAPMQELTNQHHLMQFMMNEIEAEDEDGEVLDEETKLQLFIVSSGMIGLLNQAVS